MKRILFISIILSAFSFGSACSDFFYSDDKGNEIFLAETPAKIQVDSIVVYKSERIMKVFKDKRLVKTYRIALGSNSVGGKEFQGDGKTPEGLYYIDGKNPNSDYHKNLGISYPDEVDIKYAAQYGRSAGGDIKIHGFPNGYTFYQRQRLAKDWTIGCIAVTDKEIDELYEAVPIGTPILILP